WGASKNSDVRIRMFRSMARPRVKRFKRDSTSKQWAKPTPANFEVQFTNLTCQAAPQLWAESGVLAQAGGWSLLLAPITGGFDAISAFSTGHHANFQFGSRGTPISPPSRS